MSDDILDLLRSDEWMNHLYGPAADEIERLRAENKFLRQFADDLETASEIDRVRFTSKIISLEMELRHE